MIIAINKYRQILLSNYLNNNDYNNNRIDITNDTSLTKS